MIVALFALAVTLGTLAFSAWRYVDIRRAEQRQQRFVNYHKLVSALVSPNEAGVIKLDSQIAIIYELRFYPEYKGVTVRILKALPQEWKDTEQRLLDEISLTLVALGEKR